MYLGKIVESGPVEDVFESPKHPYTMLLLSSIQATEYTFPRIKSIGSITATGEPPSPAKPPSGCRFNIRCPFESDICKQEQPILQRAGNNHYVACHLWREI